MRHRLERLAGVILIETGDDDAFAPFGKLVDGVENIHVKKLGLVDTDDLGVVGDLFHHLGRRGDRDGKMLLTGMRRDLLFRITDIDDRFKDLYFLPRDAGALQAADQFLRLARKHRSGNNLDPAYPTRTHFPAFVSVVERKFFNHNFLFLIYAE